MTHRTFVCLTLALAGAFRAHSGTITAADTAGLSATYTTSDGYVTLNAFAATDPLTAGNFNTGTGWIGVSDAGNANAINDADGSPLTGVDQQAIDIVLNNLSFGLSGLTFQYSRADGPAATDGIQISGFLSDPLATESGGSYEDLRYDAGLHSIFFALSGTDYSLGPQTLTFVNLAASAGQTLRITANDSDQGGSQAAIVSIGYAVVPEPSVVAMLALGGLALFGVWRHRS